MTVSAATLESQRIHRIKRGEAIEKLRERETVKVPLEVLNRTRQKVFALAAEGLRNEEIGLEQFFIDAWPIIEPATPLVNLWYIGYLAEHFEAVLNGQITRLAVSIHPRSAKSNLGTVLFPPWVWTRQAWKRFMCISYSQELATEHSLKRRRVIESSYYHSRWGKMYQIMADQNRKNVFENSARGMMIATSSTGTATGRGADIQIYDDFLNPKEAASESERKAAIEAYSNTFSSRLNDPKNGAMIVLAQRTHTHDLTGHVLAEGGWVHVDLPIIADKRTIYSFPLSKKEHVREVGDILNPARHDASTIAKQKRASGSRDFMAQWMGKPTGEEGIMVAKTWWRFYKDDPRVIAARAAVMSQSWDFAFKDLQSSSWVVGLTGAKVGSQIYLVDEDRGHWDFVKTSKAVAAAKSRWPKVNYVFYEDKANGPAVKSYLTGKVSGLIPVETLGSKEARMASATPDIEAGDVLLPYPYDEAGIVLPGRQWVVDFVEELSRFPEEPNDRGDALSQLIIKMNSIVLYNGGVENEEAGSIVALNGETPMADLDVVGGFENILDFGGDDGTL